MIDGNWPETDKPKMSDDGSIELIKSCPKTHLVDMPDTMPRDKYDRLLHECGKLDVDYLVILDSDEYIKQPFDYEQFKNDFINIEKYYKACTFSVKMEYWDGTWQEHFPHYRLVFNPSICRYGMKHNQLWCDDQELFSRYSKRIDSLVFVHDKRYKTQEYIEQRRKWNLSHPEH